MFPVGTGRAGRDSGHERCPSNPALISFIPGTINPSSLPLQPEPLKLTITQSECLFGIIQARGKVRDGGEEGSRFFSARYGPSCGAGVVLERDECSNSTRQTELGWESSGHRDTRYSRSMGTLPQPVGTLGIPIPWGHSAFPSLSGGFVSCQCPYKLSLDFWLLWGEILSFPDDFSTQFLQPCSISSLTRSLLPSATQRQQWEPGQGISTSRPFLGPWRGLTHLQPQSRGIPNPNPPPDKSPSQSKTPFFPLPDFFLSLEVGKDRDTPKLFSTRI